MRTNRMVVRKVDRTHEGAKIMKISKLMELRRAMLTCMLFEDTFYEDGESIAYRIMTLGKEVKYEDAVNLAVEARTKGKLRHVPLWLMLSRLGAGLRGSDLAKIIKRVDEITEFLALYERDGIKPIPKQVKVGLGIAFNSFDKYQLAKYKAKGKQMSLAKALRLVHPKPKDDKQSKLFKGVLEETLVADTWERRLSTGGDKKESFEDLLRQNKLGYMALLRNLRNMRESGVDENLVLSALVTGAAKSKALPFRFITAARMVPDWEATIDAAMQLSAISYDRMPGKTAIVVDNSGSMNHQLNSNSVVSRIDAAGALAVYARMLFADCTVWSYSNDCKKVPARKGMALIDAIQHATDHGGTYTGEAIRMAIRDSKPERIVVISDGQSHDARPDRELATVKHKYFLNVAPYSNGVGYSHDGSICIDGYSEHVFEFAREVEAL